MPKRAVLLEALGGEAGCKSLSASFYARAGRDPTLRPLFPGKSLRCAIEEFAAFLIQFLGGEEEQTQKRWWLSVRESHARFRIGPAERRAWLQCMAETLNAAPLDDKSRAALRQFFEHSSAYVIGEDTAGPQHHELAARWNAQRVVDDAIAAIAAGRDSDAIQLAMQMAARPAMLVGVLGRMMQSGRRDLIRFVTDSVQRDPTLATRRYGGRTLLHFASASGRLEVVEGLLRLGTEPDVLDSGGHTPLYSVANECASEKGPRVVRALVQAGADVNASGGVTRTTPLHMAARRGHQEIALALLDLGASVEARDRKGDTPLDRAIHCRKETVIQLLLQRGAAATAKRR
jgi:truncated hemoglobin YjbI